jgi:hypothetical protein
MARIGSLVLSIKATSNQMPTKVTTVQKVQTKQHKSVQGMLEYLQV